MEVNMFVSFLFNCIFRNTTELELEHLFKFYCYSIWLLLLLIYIRWWIFHASFLIIFPLAVFLFQLTCWVFISKTVTSWSDTDTCCVFVCMLSYFIVSGKNTGVVAISSSRGSFWPRDGTLVSCIFCISRQILYHWATWEAQIHGRGRKTDE